MKSKIRYRYYAALSEGKSMAEAAAIANRLVGEEEPPGNNSQGTAATDGPADNQQSTDDSQSGDTAADDKPDNEVGATESEGTDQPGKPAGDGLPTDDEMREAIKVATGTAPHWKLSRENLIAQYQALEQ